MLGTQFAGGVFLGTALMHFLSDANETFHDLSDKDYPFAFMLASAGYVITMLADCVISMVVARGRSIRDVEGGEANVYGGELLKISFTFFFFFLGGAWGSRFLVYLSLLTGFVMYTD